MEEIMAFASLVMWCAEENIFISDTRILIVILLLQHPLKVQVILSVLSLSNYFLYPVKNATNG